MSWFFIAIVGPFLYALTNHIDKILLERYFKQSGVGTLILFSSLLSVLALPFLLYIDPTVLDISLFNIFVLAILGVLNVLVLWFYLLALMNEEASVAVIFYQLVPVFGLILGYFILDEVLSKIQLIAMAIIILGTTIISFEVNSDNKFTLRRQTILYMTVASFCWALSSVIFKSVALEENVWRTLFWEHLMMVIVGILVFMFAKSYRQNFLLALRENSKSILSLNVLNESLYMLGNIAFSFAYLLAPIALVLLTQSFQPFFVLVIGIILTLFFPRISVEKIEAKHLWQKVIAICITGIGAYMLLFIS
jgi:drug/metabolite transporter (DMT)-like permease